MARHPALTLGRAGPAGLAGLAGASFVMVGTAVARLRPAVRAVHPDLCSPWLYVPVWAPRRMPPYAAAARREDLRGLPPAWVGVAELDLLHDEGVDYATRLRAAGVPCALHVEQGMDHGADATSSAPSMCAFRGRMAAALRAAVGEPGPPRGLP